MGLKIITGKDHRVLGRCPEASRPDGRRRSAFFLRGGGHNLNIRNRQIISSSLEAKLATCGRTKFSGCLRNLPRENWPIAMIVHDGSCDERGIDWVD